MACGLVGAASGVFGVLGVFTKGASSIGVPVLLALAAFFGYLAVSGQRLRTLKLGEYEAGFDQIANAVRRGVLENPEVPAETKEDVAAELEGVRAELPSSTRRAVSRILTDQERAELMANELRTQLSQLFPVEFVGDYTFLDGRKAILLRRGDRELAVDFRLASSGNMGFAGAFLTIADVKGYAAEMPGPMRLLLVSNGRLSEPAAELLKAMEHGRDQAGFVQWRGGIDNGALAEAINARLNPPPAGTIP